MRSLKSSPLRLPLPCVGKGQPQVDSRLAPSDLTALSPVLESVQSSGGEGFNPERQIGRAWKPLHSSHALNLLTILSPTRDQ